MGPRSLNSMDAAVAAVDDKSPAFRHKEKDMKKSAFLPAAAAALGILMTAMGPVQADSQKNKNTWRNLAIGAGVVAGHGLITHNGTETILGAAGAAYSANRYEQDRHHQSQASAARARYYRNHHRVNSHKTYRHTYTTTRTTPRSYHRSYTNGNRKYYTYDGHKYYQNLNTGSRVRVW